MRQGVIAISAMLILSGIAPTSANDSAFSSFSEPAWRNAPERDPQNWSRESLLAGLPELQQMQRQDRATIIARLGQPGTSSELYTPGAGRHARLDIYRLSTKNDHVLRIDYDAEDKLNGDSVDSMSCGCPLCSKASPDMHANVRMDVLARTVLRGSDVNTTVTTKGRLDGLLGRAGQQYATIDQFGGQAWNNYGEIWHIVGSAERFFIASGQVPLRDRARQQDDELPITAYAIVTVGPDCLSR